MDDKREGGIKNLKKWVTPFINGEFQNFKFQNIFSQQMEVRPIAAQYPHL